MKDTKQAKRLRLLHEDINRECDRYMEECKDLNTYIMTEEEKIAMENRIKENKIKENKNYFMEQLLKNNNIKFINI